MLPDINDTIAAIGTAQGGAARGMIRLSGPALLDCLAACFSPAAEEPRLETLKTARAVSGKISLIHGAELPCVLYLWPDNRSYTRQPSAEIQLMGSPALLDCALETLCRNGARLAEPGEFTLRAFLAGRLDLTQAEAVLGIIDATDQETFHTALGQLAGGLSQPLRQLREQLITLLAHLEAGLDFVEEDIEFVSAEELENHLTAAVQAVEAVLTQLATRNQSIASPRVVLLGEPNVGKSSLFNALLDEYGRQSGNSRALVSEQAGTTRDYLSDLVDLEGFSCELIDTAGEEPIKGIASIASFAQEMTTSQQAQASCRVICLEATDPELQEKSARLLSQFSEGDCLAITKCDLLSPAQSWGNAHPQVVFCSSFQKTGIDALARVIKTLAADSEKFAASGIAQTAARCHESLRNARDALLLACETLADQGGEELVAAELRLALAELGRVVGTIYTDDVLDQIFSKFCIGK